MNDVVRILKRELEVLQATIGELEAVVAKAQNELRPAIVRVEKIKALLADYETDEPTANANAPIADAPAAETQLQQPPERSAKQSRPGSKKAMLFQEVSAFLLANPGVHRTGILGHLVAKGLMGSEKVPLAHLAAFLSENKDAFVSDGNGHFSLRTVNGPEPPPAPDRGAGSAGGKSPGHDPGLPFTSHH
jgi:hypothetical protein